MSAQQPPPSDTPRPDASPTPQPSPASSALQAASTHPAAQTPMMRQFIQAKSEHPEAILFFRMGDFYETFFDDAVEAARLLELTLTSRNKNDEAPIPMAGVPHHALPGYVTRLLDLGRKVAICEQMEDPRKAKGIVRREVVRVITPGVILDDSSLESRQHNYLAAIATHAEGVGLAWVDVSTGDLIGATTAGLERALEELGRVDPAELLMIEGDASLEAEVARHLDRALISLIAAPEGDTAPIAQAEAMIRAYIETTQKGGALLIKPLHQLNLDGAMTLGPESVRNLELLRTMHDGRRKGAVLHLIDRSQTAMGGRLMKHWLLYPLVDVGRIRKRHDAVAALVEDPITRQSSRDALSAVYDIERLITRVVAGTAGPRDVHALASSLARVPELAHTLAGTDLPCLKALAGRLDAVDEVHRRIETALVEEPPATLKDGGVFRVGFDADLDELIEIAREGKRWFTDYADAMREQTGITSLKIRFNSVFGYFLEVTRSNLHLVPDDWLRKQTLANSERYYTPELKEREEKVLGAHDRRLALELDLFDALRREIATYGSRIQSTASVVAEIDVLAALAEVAQRQRYQRPEVDDSLVTEIEEGRHPVIEALLPDGEFVPNDISMDAETRQMIIITGPNMAGKSTVMRQVALITLLAQMGSFVPAARARIGIADQIFTRVGASDNLSKGESTFMVEMREASMILQRATGRSLVILDEIGRGTSTYDGVSIAWAVAEHLHDAIGARTLFATHYHELTELAKARERIENMSIAVREWQEEIVFLRRLVPGGASRSYGIQVGRLAGLPASVVSRAKEVLAQLEADALDPSSRPRLADDERGDAWQLSFFAPANRPGPVTKRLNDVEPDGLSPREALDLIYALKELAEEDPT